MQTLPPLQVVKPIEGSPYVRQSPGLKESADNLGPLADLVGTWVGNRGWNMIAVPFPHPDPATPFTLLVKPYMETITFSPIGAQVPNRFAGGIDFVTGLLYDLRISTLDTNQPMHVENGMWLFVDPDAAGGSQSSVARVASIPHGDSILATGSFGTVCGAPTFGPISGLPLHADGSPITFAPYIKQYGDDKTAQFDPAHPEQTLANAIAGVDVVETTFITLSTNPNGGLLNIPFIKSNVNTTSFDCVFWVEKIKSASGQIVEQLQYTQTSILDFVEDPAVTPPDPNKLIQWPHINLNTLVKQ